MTVFIKVDPFLFLPEKMNMISISCGMKKTRDPMLFHSFVCKVL